MSTAAIADKIQKELGEEVADPELRKRISEWLTADKEFNVWFLVTTKRQLGDEDLMALLDGYRESQEIVENAWDDYRKKKDGAALLVHLEDSLKRMKELQARG